MSDDSYYLIRKTPDGRFVALLGSSSARTEPVYDENSNSPFFSDPVDALLWAQAQPSEYGATIHPECGNLKISKSDQP